MNDTPDRRKQVDFVDYLKVGQSIMVKKGNPDKISTLESLSGHTVSVESGTTNRDFLAATSKKLVEAGQEGDQHQDVPEGHGRLRGAEGRPCGRVLRRRAARSRTTRRRTRRSSSPGAPVNPFPIGIAIRKNDPLRAATQKAIASSTPTAR